jgi:hypothetical protein
LGEDLVFSDDHGIEARDDPEKMSGDLGSFMSVEAGHNFFPSCPSRFGQKSGSIDLLLGMNEINFYSIAGGKQEALFDRQLFLHIKESFRQFCGSKGELFPQVNSRLVVI